LNRAATKGDLIPVPLNDYVMGKLRHSLIVLWSAVGVILLIAGVTIPELATTGRP
jgi:hypothetical protein